LNIQLGLFMPDYVLGILIFVPYILAVSALAICWRNISNRFLFLVTASLALAGLQAWVAPGAVYVLLLGTEELTKAAAHAAFSRTVTLSAMLQILLGVPFLGWLYRGFQNPNSQFDAGASHRST